MKLMLAVILLLFIHASALGAVILQYHHVSNTAPKNTSITPTQFEAHLTYLKEHNFNVVPLSQIIEKIKNQQPIKDKTVAITFDDAYVDILNHATPLLNSADDPGNPACELWSRPGPRSNAVLRHPGAPPTFFPLSPPVGTPTQRLRRCGTDTSRHS